MSLDLLVLAQVVGLGAQASGGRAGAVLEEAAEHGDHEGLEDQLGATVQMVHG